MRAHCDKAFVSLMLVVLLPACSGPPQPQEGPASQRNHDASSVDLPPGCEIERVASTVTSYLTSYNSNQAVKLDDHFAPVHQDRPAPNHYSKGFQWFADNGGPDEGGFLAYWPGPPMSAYIDELREAGERQDLEALYVNNYSRDQDWALFGFVLRRERPGLAANLSLGKGAVRCRDLRITLWNLGPPGSGEDRPDLCDYDATAEDDAVVCV